MRHWQWALLRSLATKHLEATETLAGCSGAYGSTRFKVRIGKDGKYHYTINGPGECQFTGAVDGTLGGLKELRGIIHDVSRRAG